jgi:hypothetical protein
VSLKTIVRQLIFGARLDAYGYSATQAIFEKEIVMVRSQLHRAAAALALTSILFLIPGRASAAAPPRRDHGRTTSAKPQVESRRGPGLLNLTLLLLEKMSVKIDPNGLMTNPDSTDPH